MGNIFKNGLLNFRLKMNSQKNKMAEVYRKEDAFLI